MTRNAGLTPRDPTRSGQPASVSRCAPGGGPVWGKSTGRHPSEALTGTFVHAVQLPGFYADGNGLYLRVDAAGCKRWILRTVVQGKRRDIGLGGLSCTSLVEARVRAKMLRKIAREGGDPFAAREQVCGTRHPEVTQAVSN